jgi:hypothetical protein
MSRAQLARFHDVQLSSSQYVPLFDCNLFGTEFQFIAGKSSTAANCKNLLENVLLSLTISKSASARRNVSAKLAINQAVTF